MLITIVADTKKELDYKFDALKKRIEGQSMKIRRADFMMEECFDSCLLPLAKINKELAKKSHRNQCVTKALRAAKKHGYVEVFMRDESRYVRISPDGLKYIRSTQKDALDVDKRAAMKRRIKGEQGRLTRVETTLCMCRAAGIQPAKEASIKLIDVLDPEQDAAQTFMNDFFYDKGLLFLSDEISATIKTSTTMGEEYTLGQSRLVGIVINRTGISFLYCTLDKLMLTFMSTDEIENAVMNQDLPTKYAFELSAWDEILSWKLAPSSIYIYGLEFCLSRVLWEMTFFGVDESGVELEKEKLDTRFEEAQRFFDENKEPQIGFSIEDIAKKLLGDDYTEDWYPEEEQERDRRNMVISSYIASTTAALFWWVDG